MSFTLNRITCLVVVDPSQPTSLVSPHFLYLNRFDLDELLHIIAKLPALQKFSISLKMLSGHVSA
ncbi:hypothetical protein PM082_002095 [Marasmius tenuissimus]|nr:hypothetical protein PM082_002095 [Marasmius tenuissimus]